MFMLGVMRVAVNVGPVFGRLRREVHFGVVDTDSTTEVHIITPLENCESKHRNNVKVHIPFSTPNRSCRTDFYGMVAECYFEHGRGIVTYIFYAEQVKPYDSSDHWPSPLLMLLLHVHLKDVGFAYANANADDGDACSDADASA